MMGVVAIATATIVMTDIIVMIVGQIKVYVDM